MEQILSTKYFHNSLENWLVSFGIVVGVILFARLVYLVLRVFAKMVTSKTKTKIDDIILEKMERPMVMMIILGGLRFSFERLHFATKIENYVENAFVLLIAINITLFAVRVFEALIENYLVPYSQKDDNTLDTQKIMLIERGMKIIVWSVGIILGLNNAGIDVGALVAGLGIGGLAVALAAQDTVKNIFGGVTIFLDKPFRISDRIVINGLDGFVEYIGIRSTRLRTLEGRLITIPNAQFSENPIENITIEPARRVVTTLGLIYNTSTEKMQLAINTLKEISKANENIVAHGETTVYFEKFSAYSLDIKFIYFIKKEADIFETQHVINIQVLQKFNENNLEFAYPTQTIYRKSLD
jgi:MscS family membrane protein